ncbi:MAG: choice-of-anchor L domain-containing protein [Byssovorax sp.]
MTKGTRSLGRAAALLAPMLLATFAAACSGGGTSSSGSPTSTSSGMGGNGAGGDKSTSSTMSTSGTNGTTGSGGTGGVANPKCTANADCANDPKGKVCDTVSGTCVECTPTSDGCAQGLFCDATTNTCKVGCTDNTDCATPGNTDLLCDLTTNTCAGCIADADCPLGSVCFAATKTCTAGCTDTQACQAGLQCCGGTCFDLSTATNHCGSCANSCVVPDHAAVTCVGSMCGMGACDMGFANCDNLPDNGCEQNTLQDGACTCVPGTTQSCYQGAPGTMGVGPCKGGTQTCNANGTSWTPCGGGQVLPKSEICANGVDDDCDGVVDNVPDVDGDGWTACNGDCNDSNALVNPGAFEVVGNGIDDDCDPASSDVNPAPTCSTVKKSSGVNALDVAKAMDLCQTTTANPPLATKKWGLITQTQLLANGAVPNATDLANIQNFQSEVILTYGNIIKPHKGATMAGVSTGAMRVPADGAQFVNPVGGSSYLSTIPFTPLPAAPLGTYMAAHSNNLLPGKCGNNPCTLLSPAQDSANDSVDVQLKIRVPTNAKSLSYDFRFFSGEYQTFQCTAYNDYYLAMLTSGAPGIPVDHNISFDTLGNAVSVNNGFFDVCGGNGKNCGNCPSGIAELAGTGMDTANGGGTTWLTTDAPVVSGETITLDLVIFDVGDHAYDSLVLLDNFRWGLNTTSVTTHM